MAGVNHEENLVVSPFRPHLFESVGQFDGRDLLRILKLQEAFATVTFKKIEVQRICILLKAKAVEMQGQKHEAFKFHCDYSKELLIKVKRDKKGQTGKKM